MPASPERQKKTVADPLADVAPKIREDIEAMYARMQGPEAGKAMKAAFDASPEELARAALAAARKQAALKK
jgi:hypothetical protein